MKKYALISLLIIPLLLSGCSVQKKPAASTSPTPTATSTSSSVDTNAAANATASVTSTASVNTAIETQYQTNFSAAKADANQILQNGAKFCSVTVKFPGPNISQVGDEFFFFYSDTLVTDYYWLDEFDGLNSNAKKRYFAARRDFTGDITCSTTQPATAPSFVDAFTTYLTQYQIPSTTVSLQMSLQDTTWNIVARDLTGATTSNGQVPVAATVAQTASPTATATSTVTAQ